MLSFSLVWDYCNSLHMTESTEFTQITACPKCSCQTLHQNPKKRAYLSHFSVASLHWIPVNFGIDFKILLITVMARSGLTPRHISDLLTPYVPGCNLRSSAKALQEQG